MSDRRRGQLASATQPSGPWITGLRYVNQVIIPVNLGGLALKRTPAMAHRKGRPGSKLSQPIRSDPQDSWPGFRAACPARRNSQNQGGLPSISINMFLTTGLFSEVEGEEEGRGGPVKGLAHG